MAGQPTKYVNAHAKTAEKLCQLGATDKDIAGFFEVHGATIYRWKALHRVFRKALAYAESEVRKLARTAAEKAGTAAVELTCKTDEQEVEAAGGQTFFIEARVVATATGRPRLAVR